MNQFPLLLLSFILISLSTPATAASNDGVKGSWFLSVDNDLLAKSDDDYTNGLQAGWVSGYLADYADGPIPKFLANGLDGLGMFSGDNKQKFISYSFSHRIFTPGDTQTTTLIKGDIPYSGMLFATVTAGAQDDKKMHAISLHVGVAGPAALGRQVQNGFHKVIGSDRVNGWDNQIGNEVLVNLNYEHRRRLAAFNFGSGLRADVLGQAGATAGNLISMATLGIGGRIGWGLQDDYAMPPQFFGDETIGSRPYSKGSSSGSSKGGFWFYALINGSAIGNAVFWDGNTFRDSPSVNYDPLIGQIYIGAAKRFDNLKVSFTLAKTTAPWDNPSDKAIQTYGKLNFSYGY